MNVPAIIPDLELPPVAPAVVVGPTTPTGPAKAEPMASSGWGWRTIVLLFALVVVVVVLLRRSRRNTGTTRQ